MTERSTNRTVGVAAEILLLSRLLADRLVNHLLRPRSPSSPKHRRLLREAALVVDFAPPPFEPDPTHHKPSDSMSQQCFLVLEFLRSGKTLTNLIALTTLGIGSLSSRVAELRKRGYDIDGEIDHNPSTGKAYMKYRLYEAHRNIGRSGHLR